MECNNNNVHAYKLITAMLCDLGEMRPINLKYLGNKKKLVYTLSVIISYTWCQKASKVIASYLKWSVILCYQQ